MYFFAGCIKKFVKFRLYRTKSPSFSISVCESILVGTKDYKQKTMVSPHRSFPGCYVLDRFNRSADIDFVSARRKTISVI